MQDFLRFKKKTLSNSVKQNPSRGFDNPSDGEDFSAFYSTRKFITVFKEPYPEAGESSSRPHTLLLKRRVKII
jgi:hypothetical protein